LPVCHVWRPAGASGLVRRARSAGLAAIGADQPALASQDHPSRAALSSAPLGRRFIDANSSPLNSTNRSQCSGKLALRQTSKVSIAILLEDGVRTQEFEQPRGNSLNNTEHY
jgi:hypothetical protein